MTRSVVSVLNCSVLAGLTLALLVGCGSSPSASVQLTPTTTTPVVTTPSVPDPVVIAPVPAPTPGVPDPVVVAPVPVPVVLNSDGQAVNTPTASYPSP